MKISNGKKSEPTKISNTTPREYRKKNAMKIENAQNLSIQRAKKNNITGGLGEKKYHRSDETAFVQLLSAKVTLNNPIAIILVFGSSLLCVVPVGSTDTYTAPAPAHRAYTFTQNV